jgi:REP element-mobilizing transposase RayT
MARPLRIAYPGAYFHITARGVAQHDIFLADEDRRVFLSQLGQAHQRWGLVFHGYCLMGNHHHLEVHAWGDWKVSWRHWSGGSEFSS